MQCMASSFWSEEYKRIDGMKEAMKTKLFDNIAVILNEGAMRGLTERFLKIGDIIHVGDKEWLKSHLRMEAEGDSVGVSGELSLVGGMLLWISEGPVGSYYTRSGLAARISGYLREVGYPLNQPILWDGNGLRPAGSRTVVLVTGGCSDTDVRQLTPWTMMEDQRTLY